MSDLFSPLTGEAVEINTALADDPGLINTDACGAGWQFTVRSTGQGELLTADEYTALIGSE
jgi:glycine cleavage system H protein